MDFFLSDGSWLFTAALLIVAAIGVLELGALMVGGSMSSSLDGMLGDLAEVGGLAWLHVGRLPFLVILVILLASFAFVGLMLQALVTAVLDHPLPSIVASPVAVLAALPATRAVGSGLIRILPHDESAAIAASTFIGRTATLTSGEAISGRAAEARFQDEYGQTHYVMVEPDAQSPNLRAGERVLLLREISVGRYLATSNPVSE